MAKATPLSNVACPTCGGKVLVPGRVGGFLLHEHIGEGEMGTIYRATDESLNREVAVKLVRGCQANDRESCERLRREACAAGKLNHPRVAQVYALNFSNGHPFLVMELVTGQDFAQKLEREGHIDERTALRMALDVADGLSALNREGLVHGDIKPANIVLDRDGNAKLVDFGLSGMMRRDGRGNLVGTPNYIAPELLRGAPDSHRSDLYSLGATLYHLLCGQPPLDGEKTVDILKARLFKQPVPLGKRAHHVSTPTQKLIMRMLELSPEKRQLNSDVVASEIRTALALLDAPDSAAPGASGLARRFFARFGSSPPPAAGAEPRQRPFVIISLGLVAVIELLIAVQEHSFRKTWEWLRQDVVGQIKSLSEQIAQSLPKPAARPAGESAGNAERAAPPAPLPQPPPAEPVPDVFTTDGNLVWQSLNLGDKSQRGSTMQMGGTLIIQGTGTDMWKGYDRCRYVWTKASSNYVFSAQVKAIADNHSLAITGLLVKGSDPAPGPGLLFGFLGSGELFLQVREPNNKTVLIKRSERPFPLPRHLKLIRSGHVFEAYFSSDGGDWTPFGACELELPPGNTVGLSVSAQDTNTLATAKFSSIRLQLPGQPSAAKPGDVPQPAARKPARDARKK